MRTVEFLYDFMSPYSYLASTRVEAIVTRAGGTVRWRPVFLPGLMKATGNHGPTEVPAKALYVLKDVNDWARLLGLPPVVLPDPFPFLAAQANRVALVAEAQGKIRELSQRLFHRIWADGADCNSPEVLGGVLREVGLEPGPVLERAQRQELKDLLRKNTDEAVSRGAFGVPTFFVQDELFVGNDRLDFVERALRSARTP